MHKVRSRLINFRVTEEEFERLKNAAEAQGSRCLSEFARMVMLGADEIATAEAHSLDGRFSVLDKRLSVLESNVTRLMRASAVSEGDSKSGGRGVSCSKPD